MDVSDEHATKHATEHATEHTTEDAARERDVRLQDVIDGLVRDGRERSHAETLDALTEAIEREGLPPMPAPWLEAVADEVAQGNPYVVSAHAARSTDVPRPSTEVPSETLD